MVKEFHVMNVSRGVLFTREKGGRKVESIFPNAVSALAVAVEEAQNLPDVVVYVNGEVAYLSEVVTQEMAESIIESSLKNGPEDDILLKDLQPKDAERVELEEFANSANKAQEVKIQLTEENDSHNDEVTSEPDIPDLFDELGDLDVGPIINKDHSIVFGYTLGENDKVELFIQSLDPQPGFYDGIGSTKKKVAVVVDGKKRPSRNVVHDKVTSIVVKTYEYISLNFYVEINDEKTTLDREYTLINITRN